MLGGEDDAFHAGFLADTCPLAAVEIGGVEHLGRVATVAPLLVGEGVDGKVDESIELHFVPTQLIFVRQRTARSRCGGLCLCCGQEYPQGRK